MRQFVEQSKSPCCFTVLIVDDNERSDRVRQGNPAKKLYVKGAMVTPKVPNQQHEDTDLFGEVPQIGEGIISGTAPELSEVETESALNFLCECLGAAIDIEATNERQLFCLIFNFEKRADHLLPCPDFAQQSINQGLVAPSVVCWQGAEIFATLSPLRRRGQIERKQWAPVVFRHLQEQWPGRFAIAIL